ncbi:hypothetical protein ACFLZO_01575 [Patescibacteria group bacterium]
MRLYTIFVLSAVLLSPSLAFGTEDSPGSWKMMDQAKAACARVQSDRSDGVSKKYSATFDDRDVKLIVVNKEPVQASPKNGARTSKRFSFGEHCFPGDGAVLVEIARGPTDTVLIRVDENDDTYGYNVECPKGIEAIIPLVRWEALIKAQQMRDDAEAKRECVDKKLRELVQQIRTQAGRTSHNR